MKPFDSMFLALFICDGNNPVVIKFAFAYSVKKMFGLLSGKEHFVKLVLFSCKSYTHTHRTQTGHILEQQKRKK